MAILCKDKQINGQTIFRAYYTETVLVFLAEKFHTEYMAAQLRTHQY